MHRIFLNTLIAFIIVTVLVLCIKHDNRKPLFIYESSYKQVEVEKPSPKKTVSKPINVESKTNEAKKEPVKTTKVIEKRIYKYVEPQADNKISKNVNTQKQTNVVSSNKIEKKEAIKTTKVQTEVKKEQEELIAWNVWRSNLQNQIMKDTKLPIIQEGVVFKFSFDVDKYGRITNIKTSSTTPQYTPYAIQYIAPVIKSYQGKSILDFPKGSNRYITTVEGAWRISKNKKLSTPNDFYDIEKANK